MSAILLILKVILEPILPSNDDQSNQNNLVNDFTLNHEIFDDSVEFSSVVITPFGQFGKIPARFGAMIPIQFNHDFAHSEKTKN